MVIKTEMNLDFHSYGLSETADFGSFAFLLSDYITDPSMNLVILLLLILLLL